LQAFIEIEGFGDWTTYEHPQTPQETPPILKAGQKISLPI
jgi:hypothetical protein